MRRIFSLIRSNIFTICVFVIIAVSFVAVYVWEYEFNIHDLEINIVYLKNSYSILIRTGSDKKYIINGGNNSEIIRYITKTFPFYSRRIDGIFATDSDKDNIEGLINILERYDVSRVYLPATTTVSSGIASSTDTTYYVFMDMLDNGPINRKFLSMGDIVSLDKELSLEILFPATNMYEPFFDYSKASNPQLVFRFVYKGRSLLVIGDISKKIQKFISMNSDDLKSDILFTTNSASINNIDESFIKKVRPKNLIYYKKTSNNIKRIERGALLSTILPQNIFNLRNNNIRILFNENDMSITEK